jgi:hypothetical protein
MTATPSPKLRFLIADPLDGVQVFCRRLLEAYGFEPGRIRCASDSAAALAAARAEAPDFLLTDWFAKGEPTGVQLAEQVQRLNPTCRIGFLSFRVDAEVQAEAERLGRAHPALMARVLSETQGRLDPRRRIELPPLPAPVKVGETVQLAGRHHKVQAVVLSKGEQFAQLDGVRELVPAHKLRR